MFSEDPETGLGPEDHQDDIDTYKEAIRKTAMFVSKTAVVVNPKLKPNTYKLALNTDLDCLSIMVHPEITKEVIFETLSMDVVEKFLATLEISYFGHALIGTYTSLVSDIEMWGNNGSAMAPFTYVYNRGVKIKEVDTNYQDGYELHLGVIKDTQLFDATVLLSSNRARYPIDGLVTIKSLEAKVANLRTNLTECVLKGCINDLYHDILRKLADHYSLEYLTGYKEFSLYPIDPKYTDYTQIKESIAKYLDLGIKREEYQRRKRITPHPDPEIHYLTVEQIGPSGTTKLPVGTPMVIVGRAKDGAVAAVVARRAMTNGYNWIIDKDKLSKLHPNDPTLTGPWALIPCVRVYPSDELNVPENSVISLNWGYAGIYAEIEVTINEPTLISISKRHPDVESLIEEVCDVGHLKLLLSLLSTRKPGVVYMASELDSICRSIKYQVSRHIK